MFKTSKKMLALLLSAAMIAQPLATVEPVWAEDTGGAVETDSSLVSIDETFTDSSFKNYVSTNFDTNSDGYLSEDEIAAVKTIDISKCSPAIKSVNGIEVFTDLEYLYAEEQGIRSLNIYDLKELKEIDISGNLMSDLTLPREADNLVYLDISKNYITSLTSLADYDNLVYLNVRNTNLSSISVNNMKMLSVLDVSGMTLSVLDLSENTELTELYCETMTALTALDVSDHEKLRILKCGSTATTSSSITRLDVSGDIALEELDCSNSSVSDLNIDNTPSLITLNCSNAKLDSLDVSQNTKLESLTVSNNQLGKLDVKSNTALTTLTAANIGISSIDLGSQTQLVNLDLNSNLLTAIDVSPCTRLDTLVLSDNSIAGIDVSNNTALRDFEINNNNLVCIDISACEKLNESGAKFSCSGNTRDIDLETPNYDFDFTDFSVEYGFHKAWSTEDLPLQEDGTHARTSKTVGYAGLYDDGSADITGCSVDGYHLTPEVGLKTITYKYYYGIGKNTVSFKLNINNPLTVAVWYKNTSDTIEKVGNTSFQMKVGDSTSLVAKNESGDELESITWSSENDKVARVDAKTGELTAVSAGTASIYVNLNGRTVGYTTVVCHNPVTTMTFQDKSNKGEDGEYLVYGDKSVIDLDYGNFAPNKSRSIVAKFYDKDGALVSSDYSGYSCSITDADGKESKSVVRFSNGTIQAAGPGTAYLRFTSTDDSSVSITIQVNVTQRANSISMAKTATIIEGELEQITATVYPETAENRNVTWKSSDESVVTVETTDDGDVFLKGVGVGKATVTCVSEDLPDSVYASCAVTIQPDAKDISLDTTEAVLYISGTSDEKTIQLNATIDADDPSIYTTTWESSDDNVATVNNKGLVTAQSRGEAVIKCKISESRYVECKITVKQKITRISIVRENGDMAVGSTQQLTVSVTPDNANDQSMTWESNNESVATVDANGLVTAVGKGSVTIKATTNDGSNKTSSTSITVKQLVTGISLYTLDSEKNREDVSTVSLYVDKRQSLKTEVLPEDANNKNLSWESSDEKVATVSSGTITGQAPGKATITCTSKDGGNVVATCEVIVKQQITDINFKDEEATIKVGATYTPSYTIAPENADSKDLIWDSDNTSVVTVNTKGVLTAVGKGRTKITAKAADGVGNKSTMWITVTQPVTKVSLSKTSLTLKTGENQSISSTVEPNNANDRSVTWTSSNNKVVTVSNGRITAVSKGTATVTCKANDGSGKLATCSVTVTQPVTGIKLNVTKKTLVKGKTVTLKATVAPTTANNKAVTWTTSNKSVATVTSSGVVKAVGKGTATITCTAKDGSGIKAQCTITSIVRVTKVKLNITKKSVKKGTKVSLRATVTPNNANNRAVVWKTSNSKIATVSSSGVVTTKKKGKVVITCKAKDGSGKYAKCTITVK